MLVISELLYRVQTYKLYLIMLSKMQEIIKSIIMDILLAIWVA